MEILDNIAFGVYQLVTRNLHRFRNPQALSKMRYSSLVKNSKKQGFRNGSLRVDTFTLHFDLIHFHTFPKQ
jgi:hypothetical protein